MASSLACPVTQRARAAWHGCHLAHHHGLSVAYPVAACPQRACDFARLRLNLPGGSTCPAAQPARRLNLPGGSTCPAAQPARRLNLPGGSTCRVTRRACVPCGWLCPMALLWTRGSQEAQLAIRGTAGLGRGGAGQQGLRDRGQE